MPFDFEEYDAKCARMSTQELQLEWEHYTRLISSGAVATTVSSVVSIFTLGTSIGGIAFGSASIHNARKKRATIDKYLAQHNTKHHTRTRDVVWPAFVSGTIAVITVGMCSMGAEALIYEAAAHDVVVIAESETATQVVIKTAGEGTVTACEHKHMKDKKAQEALGARGDSAHEPS